MLTLYNSTHKYAYGISFIISLKSRGTIPTSFCDVFTIICTLHYVSVSLEYIKTTDVPDTNAVTAHTWTPSTHKLKKQEISGTAIYSILWRTDHSLTPRITRIRQCVPLYYRRCILHRTCFTVTWLGWTNLMNWELQSTFPTLWPTIHRTPSSYLISRLTEVRIFVWIYVCHVCVCVGSGDWARRDAVRSGTVLQAEGSRVRFSDGVT